MNNFLKQIIQSKQKEVNLLKQKLLLTKSETEKRLCDDIKETTTNLLASELAKETLTVIAEIKRHSPSKQLLATIDNPGELAGQYILGGAKSISVLTETQYFHGSPDDLHQVKKAVGHSIPVLRKDFIIDPLQLFESSLMGADVVLLIVAVLQKRLPEFIQKSKAIGLEAIIEINNETELEIAIESGANIISINNRDLNTFETSLDVAFSLMDKIPHGILSIAASGISHPSEAKLYHQAGFSGVLIAEALVKSNDPARFIQSCLGG